ncbi:hypothetical protein Glove_209g89 [Diversispora epigaea]|uniref:Zinc/iron permease n=1 Tax=Diversispora epigaea TaxID=1348612 RepID=A0A397IPS6_9GLOM|nr:hypothetical protein Glove_209g89 [Diversispora epigaea]
MFNVTKVNDCALPEEGSNLQGWILSIASGLACCVGASIVFSDIFLQKFFCARYIRITQNTDFLVASLALGAGVMLYSSFYTLMHESKKNFELADLSKGYSGLFLLIFYFVGVIGSSLINSLIHHFVSEDSMLHSHHDHVHDHPTSHPNHFSNHHHHHHHHHHHNPLEHNPHSSPETTFTPYHEQSPLLSNRMISESIDFNNNKYNNEFNGDNDNDDSEHDTVCFVDSDTDDSKVPSLESFCNHDQPHPHDNHLNQQHPLNNHHHHHNYPKDQDQDQKQLMRIGIQTALAISVHKFPEGLITFVTSKVSPSMGFALFFAIALHNISEGFTIALPLYIATKSRMKSFLYATLLGGLSQPLGALIGWLFLKQSTNKCWDHNFVYGALFGSVSGLMGVICIQGMLPQAIKNDKSNGNLVSTFFFLGVIIMGLSSALFDHARSSD